jgi:succinyl-CoA synthetase alpha subunit
MAILLDESTRVCVVGITGGRASVDTGHNLAYGTRIVCGVAPGRGGQTVAEVDVYDTCAQAAAAHDIDAVVAYVPPRAYVGALTDAIAIGPQWIHVVTEGVALHDNLRILQLARAAGVRIIGPNTSGVISPGRAKVGFLAHASWLMAPGHVAVLSRSGGFTHDLAYILTRSGYGVSTAVAIGGDAVVGQGFADLIELCEADDGTHAIVIYGEAGPSLEGEVAAGVRSGRFSKPVVAMVSGDFLDDHAEGTVFGHAGAFLAGERTRAPAKRAELAKAGVSVVLSPVQIPAALAAAGVQAAQPVRTGP